MHFTTLLLALLPLVQVQAGLFPPNGPVKMLDTKGFRKAMRRNETSIVAFVAPWCGHCQRLVPELSKAATALGGASFNPGSDASKPMIPAYAVDCDADENKALCGEMGVQGFPTVKIFPRGKYGGALDYNDERSAAAIAKTVRTKVPGKVDKVHLKHKVEEGGGGGHEGWKKVKGKGKGAGDENTIHAVLLQSPHKNNGKPPLMWKVLATTFGEHNIRFGIDTTTFADNAASASDNARDKEKKVKENWEKDSEVWVYAKGELLGEGRGRAVKWDGKNKFDALRAFFTSIVRGEDVLERMLREQYPEVEAEEKKDDEAEEKHDDEGEEKEKEKVHEEL